MIHYKPSCHFFSKNKYLFLILFLTVLLRLPSLFEPNHYADEDIYLTLGQGLRHGLVFYRDIHDNKPPFIYLLAALSGNITNFKIILFFWSLSSVILAWFLAKKLFNSKIIITLVTLIFSVFISIPFIEGNIANGENFMILPVIAAVLLLFTSKPKYFLIGLLFSLGFLFKVPVLFEYLGILFWLIFAQSKSFTQALKKVFSKNAFSYYFGFVVPVLLSLIYYFFVGAGWEYIKAAFFQNLNYLSSWENHPPFYQTDLFYRGLLILIIFSIIFIFRHKLSDKFKFIIIWFLSALFGALLSNRPYPHYLIEVALPSALLIGYFFSEKQIFPRLISLFLISLLVFIFFQLDFWHYQTVSYYQNFLKYQFHLIDKKQFYEYFGENVTRNQKIADYIKQSTQKNDQIFIWGTEPAIYVLSNRLPVGKYTVAYHINDFNGFEETIDGLKANPPKFIIYFPDNNQSFPQLDDILNRYYFLDKKVNNTLVFQKR